MRREKDQVRHEIEEGIDLFNIGHIQGGTHAGWKKEKPAREPWQCPQCGHENRRYFVRCQECKHDPSD